MKKEVLLIVVWLAFYVATRIVPDVLLSLRMVIIALPVNVPSQKILMDAEELLHAFYGDLSRWMFYGNDMCKSIFAGHYATLEEMKKCIHWWLSEYKNKYFIRFSVIDKANEKAIGTIEVFDNIHRDKNQNSEVVECGGVLHIDFAIPYETQEYISELLNLADAEFFRLFDFKYLLIRAVPDAKERVTALLSAGYEPFHWEREHYYMKKNL